MMLARVSLLERLPKPVRLVLSTTGRSQTFTARFGFVHVGRRPAGSRRQLFDISAAYLDAEDLKVCRDLVGGAGIMRGKFPAVPHIRGF